MKNLIQCGTCGYPLTPEERGGLIEVYGVMVKPDVPCCGKYETCTQACTPRGRFLGNREALEEQPARTLEELYALSREVSAEQPAQQESVRFKCTVIDDEHPGGVPLERWGQQPAQFDPSAGTQVSKVWWDGDKLMTKPIPLESIYKEPEQPAQQEPVAWEYGDEIFWHNAPDINDHIRSTGKPLFYLDTSQPAQQERLPAILESKEAMKLALDALEKLVRFESDSWEIGSCRIAGQATRALREALADQPAQRCPLCNYQHGHAIGCKNNPVDIALKKMAENARELGIQMKPAQRKPLTDEEINGLVLPESGAGTVRDLIRIIEAAHGIKGDA